MTRIAAPEVIRFPAHSSTMEGRNLIDSSYDRVKNILQERRPALERIVKSLIEKETLDESESKTLLES